MGREFSRTPAPVARVDGPYRRIVTDIPAPGSLPALEALERRKGVLDQSVEINRIENEADRVYKDAIGRLFEEERDPITLIKWKEILSLLEQATDRAEDVANLLENVVVKHG